MTVGTKLHQTISQLKSCAGNLQGFALDTDDPQAKQMFTSASQQLDQIVQQVNARTNYVEQQEPTYKMGQMAQQAAQQQQQQQQQQQRQQTTQTTMHQPQQRKQQARPRDGR